jgi:protoporphyrinogen oxidase
VWKPLLVAKFGEQYRDIAMAWMWGKIKLRGKSKEKGHEVLGYINGSCSLIFDKLLERLGDSGTRIYLGCSVTKIKKDAEGVILETQKGSWRYDKVIAALPLPVFAELAADILPEEYKKRIASIEHTSVVCTILQLKRPFSQFYWLNIGDESIPFGGLIEHTNLMDKKLYNNKNIMYISNYVYKDSKYYNMSNEELLQEYIPHLKKINPEFDESWIEKAFTFRDHYAQPVIKCGYSALKPEFGTPVKGLYTAGMCNIYPEDRGMNYAIRDGIAVADIAVKKTY